jgi:hypothetical protein
MITMASWPLPSAGQPLTRGCRENRPLPALPDLLTTRKLLIPSILDQLAAMIDAITMPSVFAKEMLEGALESR